MAFPNWSDPSASQQNTPAEIQSRAQVHGPDITGVVQAVIRNKMLAREQQLQQQQQMQNALNSYFQNRQSDLSAQNALDVASNYDNPNPTAEELQARQINDMPGRPSLAYRNLQELQKSDRDRVNQAIENNLRTAQTQNIYAKMGEPDDPLVDERRRQLIAEGKMRDARNQFGALTGTSGPGIDAASQSLAGYIPGQTPWPETVGQTKITTGSAPNQLKDKILDAWYRMQGVTNPYAASQPANSGLASGAPTAAGAPGVPGQHSTNDPQVVAALDWVANNKKDPRAPDVLRKLGYDPTEYLANLP